MTKFIKLTEQGVNLYRAVYAVAPPLKNGYFKIQLWQLMNIYGRFMYNGNPNPPFENMEVEIERVV